MPRSRKSNTYKFEALDVRQLLTVSLMDLNLDGDTDIVASPREGWFENVDGRFEHRESRSPRDHDAILADIDGDGADNIVQHNFWYEFKDGEFLAHPYSIGTPRLRRLRAIDVGADGDLDIVARSDDREFFLAENRGGTLSTPEKIEPPEVARLIDVDSFDFDLDGDLDFLVRERLDDEYLVEQSWYLNDGDGSFTKQTIIEHRTRFASEYSGSSELLDIDGDGDLDIYEVSSSELAGGWIASWLENPETDGPWSSQTIKYKTHYNTRDPVVWKMHDSDRDGDLDAMLSDGSQLENTGDGFVPCCKIQMVGFELNSHEKSFGDVNSDDVLDLISIREQELFWYDGTVVSDEVQIEKVANAIGTRNSAANIDVVRNGIIDEADFQYLIEEVLEVPWGDSDLDHVFDTSDIVLAFRAGEYEDDIAHNSNWAEGDWNGDGDFDSSDLIRVFQAGAYGQSRRIAGSSIVGTSPDFEDVSVLFDDDLETRLYFSRDGADQTFSIRFDFDREYEVEEIRLRHGLGEAFLPFSAANPIVDPIEVNYYNRGGDVFHTQTLTPNRNRFRDYFIEYSYEVFQVEPVKEVLAVELKIEACEVLVHCRWTTGLHDIIVIGRGNDE